jgi:hypothetical protein
MVQKELQNFLKWFWKGFLKWYDGGEENGLIKKDFEVAIFFSSQNIDFPFLFEETLGAFFFFFSLSFSIPFISFFYVPSLWGLRDFDHIWGERQPSKILFKWHGMIWLILDYEDGGVLDISAVGAYSRVELCMPIFLGEASK